MDDLLLYKFLQNEASEDEIKTVLDWLDADPANRKYFDELDNMLNAARVNRPAGRKPQRRPLPTLRNIGAWSMRIAAVLCLCLGVSYFAATKMFDRKASNNSLSVFVPNGERISMTLTDGTTVWLNSGTTLEYPAVFARAERRVKVTGEAMFDVKSDPQHPFVVETFACDVREFSPPTCSAAGFRSATGRTAATGSRWSRTRRSIWKTESCSCTRRRTPTNCFGRTASSA